MLFGVYPIPEPDPFWYYLNLFVGWGFLAVLPILYWFWLKSPKRPVQKTK